MGKRDLMADLAWIENIRDKLWDSRYAVKKKLEHLMIEESFEGWPHAIERAIKAETLVRELMGTLEGVQRLKPLIAYPDDVSPEFEEEAITIAHMLNTIDSVVAKAKEVLGDE